MIDRLAIIVVNYRDYARRYLPDCLASLRRQTWRGKWELFIVDNESTAETFGYLATTAPEARIIINRRNDGFAKGNNDGIRAARGAGYQHVVLLNLDTVVAEDWLATLLDAVPRAEQWGAIQSRLMLHPQTDVVNSLGNHLHYLGFGFSYGNGLSWPLAGYDRKIVEVPYASGGAMLINLVAFDAVGGFDEAFWMYHDDLELGWKMRLAGYRQYLAPRSVVYHKYQFVKSIKQYYWMERNRGIVLLTSYRWLTLFCLLPPLLIMEVGLLAFAFVQGYGTQKLKSYVWFIDPRHWPYVFRRRRQISRLRRVPDRAIAVWLTGRIEYQEIRNPLLAIVNPLFELYWAVVRRLMIW